LVILTISDVESQNFDDINSKIEYLDKFKSWRFFIDSFETRQQVLNFFGDSSTPMEMSNGTRIIKIDLKFGGALDSSVDYSQVTEYNNINGTEINYFYESYLKSFIPQPNQKTPMSLEEFVEKNPKADRTFYFDGFNWFEMSIVFYFTKNNNDLISSWESSPKMKRFSDKRFIRKVRKHYAQMNEKQLYKRAK
jgi:hypothetical protein